MYLFMAMLLKGILLGSAVAGAASVILTFTKYRHSEIVFICALPAFVVGVFYTGCFLLSWTPFDSFMILVWALLILGTFSIFRWCYKRP